MSPEKKTLTVEPLLYSRAQTAQALGGNSVQRIQDDLQQPSKTIPQFCEAENLSASSYFKLKRLGLGPDEMRFPGTEIVRITPEAHRAWRERMTELSQTKQAELERQRRVAQRRDAGLASSRKRHSKVM